MKLLSAAMCLATAAGCADDESQHDPIACEQTSWMIYGQYQLVNCERACAVEPEWQESECTYTTEDLIFKRQYLSFIAADGTRGFCDVFRPEDTHPFSLERDVHFYPCDP